MKYQFQITTGQFEYINQEGEFETPQSAVEAYKSLKEAYTVSGKPSEGMTDKELDLVVQNMCLGKSTSQGTELWAKATPEQRKEINRLKRALDRIKRKGEEPEIYDEQIITTHEDQL